MALLQATSQRIEDWAGEHMVVTTITRGANTSTDTVVLPEGIRNAAHVTSLRETVSDTALTIDSISQGAHPAGITVTMSGGSTGGVYHILSIHAGNLAGL
jgi:hypothetical protein